jgi:hypothetical protein
LWFKPFCSVLLRDLSLDFFLFRFSSGSSLSPPLVFVCCRVEFVFVFWFSLVQLLPPDLGIQLKFLVSAPIRALASLGPCVCAWHLASDSVCAPTARDFCPLSTIIHLLSLQSRQFDFLLPMPIFIFPLSPSSWARFGSVEVGRKIFSPDSPAQGPESAPP